MTHDYAKKPAPKKKKPRKTSNKKPSQVPGWVWLFTGIVTGLFLAFLGYLADVTPQQPQSEPAAKQQAAKKPKPQARDNETKFDFYTLLPEREVIVPVEPETGDNEPREQVFYLLQTGSFRNAADADRQRASLLLLGLDAKVDKVQGNNGDTWHRVQVGPFTNRSKLSKARGMLVDKGINPLTLKKKA